MQIPGTSELDTSTWSAIQWLKVLSGSVSLDYKIEWNKKKEEPEIEEKNNEISEEIAARYKTYIDEASGTRSHRDENGVFRSHRNSDGSVNLEKINSEKEKAIVENLDEIIKEKNDKEKNIENDFSENEEQKVAEKEVDFENLKIETLGDFLKSASNCKNLEEYKKLYDENIQNLTLVDTKVENGKIYTFEIPNDGKPFREDDFKTSEEKANYFKDLMNSDYLPKGKADPKIPTPDDNILQNKGIGEVLRVVNNYNRLSTSEGHDSIKNKVQDTIDIYCGFKDLPENKIEGEEVWDKFLQETIAPDGKRDWFIEGKELPPMDYGGELLKGWTIEKNTASIDQSFKIMKQNEDGIIERKTLPSSLLVNAIIAHERLTDAREKATSDFDLKKARDNFNKDLGIGEDKPRLNTTENFMHNFRLNCKQNNENRSFEEIANDLYQEMSEKEQVRFDEMKKSFKKETGKDFNEKLSSEFYEIVQSKNFSKEVSKEVEETIERETPKIPSEISMAIKFNSGKDEIVTPIQNWTVAENNPEKNTIKLLSADKKYTMEMSKETFLKETDLSKQRQQEIEKTEKTQNIETQKTVKSQKPQKEMDYRER